MIDRFRNQYIYLQEGEVVWHGSDPAIIKSHREFSGDKPGQALWLKLVDPEEREGEKFEVYEECLGAGVASTKLAGPSAEKKIEQKETKIKRKNFSRKAAKTQRGVRKSKQYAVISRQWNILRRSDASCLTEASSWWL